MAKIISVIILLNLGLTVSGQNESGYFDYEKVKSSTALYRDYQNFLLAYQQHLEDSMAVLSHEIEDFYTCGVPHSIKTDSISMHAFENAMYSKIMVLSDYQLQAKRMYDAEVSRIEPLWQEKIGSLVKQYCTDRHISLLAEQNALLYCDNCTDYTKDLINYTYNKSRSCTAPYRAGVLQDSATVILKNISHSKYAEYIAMVRSQLIAGKNLKPGQSRTFKISVAGANINRFTIYLDKDHEYEYNIEPTDYLQNVSDMEITGGTYQYLIDLDKKTDALSVRLEKIN